MKFRYARDAFGYLIQKYEIKKVFMPYYLCDVMRHTAITHGAKPVFYHIGDDFMPVQEFPRDAYVLYPNYFGICAKNVEKLAKLYPKLIVDNAHAYFEKPSGFACFNSAKKFLPVKEGANLWIKDVCEECLSSEKPDFLRREMFLKYHKKFPDNELSIDVSDSCIPFCYPYLAPSVEIADKLVEKLTADGKTIYRYWNNLPKSYNEYKFYSRLVPIPLVMTTDSYYRG